MYPPADINVVRSNQESFEESCDKSRDVMHVWNYLQSLWEISKAAKWIWSPQAYVQKRNEVTRNSVCFNGRKTAGYWSCGIKLSTKGNNHCFHILSEFWKLGKKTTKNFTAVFPLLPTQLSFSKRPQLLLFCILMLPCTSVAEHNCGGLTLAGNQVLTKPLYRSPPQQDSVGENKMDKILMDQDKGSLI